MELIWTVAPHKLDLEEFEVVHECCEAGTGLFPGPSDAHEHRIATGLTDDTGDTRDVLDGVLEEYEVHLCGVGEVVVVQERGEHVNNLGL